MSDLTERTHVSTGIDRRSFVKASLAATAVLATAGGIAGCAPSVESVESDGGGGGGGQGGLPGHNMLNEKWCGGPAGIKSAAPAVK
ncbi:MAG: twin-arginine translocation signal domain-containing protein, partial [Coriobacteriales bacterium]|nr:twin-arginine translocation signal domain-containing protein [Coriobacteriales bacterium]